MSGGKSGGGAKKIGRNKKWCEAYILRRQRDKNKERKLKRHLKRHPSDLLAARARK